MNHRQRLIALMQRRRHDRVPFVQYESIVPQQEAWDLVGRENLGVLTWTNVHCVTSPGCSFQTEGVELGGRPGLRRTLRTPAGQLTEERLIEPAYGTSSAVTHLVKEPEDYEVLLAYLRDVEVRLDLLSYTQTLSRLGEGGLPHLAACRTPYQQLWVEWVGLADLAAHLTELPELMDEVTSEMRRIQTDIYKLICTAARQVPVYYVNVPDNITAPPIGERYFRKYAVEAYNELAEMLDETGQDIVVQVHMDGDLKALWGAIGDSGVRSIDSMSPPPDNDTSVADAMREWPEMRVCINFPSSVHLLPTNDIYRAAMQILEEGGRQGRLQIQISENVPADVWRTSYPAIASAIKDFGPACG